MTMHDDRRWDEDGRRRQGGSPFMDDVHRLYHRARAYLAAQPSVHWKFLAVGVVIGAVLL
ncbi:MAG: hypothetical protein ACTS3R_02660 [Inquilinaceae bacterium]